MINVSNLRIRLNELLLLVSFFFRSLFFITVAYPLFQIETSLIAICFKLEGLQLFTITVASILSSVDPFVLNLQACSSTGMYLTFSVLLFYATSNGQRPELCCEYCSDVGAFFYFTVAEKMWWESSWLAILFYCEFCFTIRSFCFCFCFCKLVNFAFTRVIEFYFPVRLFCFCFCFCKLVNFAFA